MDQRVLQQWLVRCAILLAIPLLIAFADSRVRQLPARPAPATSDTGADAEPTHPRTAEQEVAWAAAHYNQFTAAFIDARPYEQYRQGHIPGAFPLPFAAFMRGRPEVIDFLPEDIPLIIYCDGGDCDASHKVMEMLYDYGFQHLELFEAGFPAWRDAGLPTESGDPLGLAS